MCLGDGARRARGGTTLQRWTHGITQAQGPLGEVKPLRPALVVWIACRGYRVQGELEELGVATMAIALDPDSERELDRKPRT